MTLKRLALSSVFVFALCSYGRQPHLSQAPSSVLPVHDPQALSLLQNAVTAGGAAIPNDSSASGTITIVAGSQTDNGTVQILTRGTNQTMSQIQTGNKNTSIIFANDHANAITAATATALPMEMTVSSQCLFYPFPFIASVLNNPDWSYRYVGLENIDGNSVQHLQVWNSYASHPKLQFLSEFTQLDIWLGPTTNLPATISFFQRNGGGAAPKISVSISYSDYRTVSGLLYPYAIHQSFNGTPWATITIQSVAFNTGLSDNNFPIQ